MRCPKCNHRLLRKSDGKAKLRVPILVFDEDGGEATTNCPSCKSEIQIPGVTLEKSAAEDCAVDPPLVLGKRRLTLPRGDP